jgi:hypothetical protein
VCGDDGTVLYAAGLALSIRNDRLLRCVGEVGVVGDGAEAAIVSTRSRVGGDGEC